MLFKLECAHESPENLKKNAHFDLGGRVAEDCKLTMMPTLLSADHTVSSKALE